MKRFFSSLVVCVLVLVFLTACSGMQQGVSGLMQLPDEGRILVLSLVSAGVTWALLKLSIVFKIDLKGYTNAVATALAPILITVIEGWLQLIPPVYDNVVLTLIHLVVLLVGSLGAFFLFKRQAASLR